MSGGVDSAVAASLLCEQGYDVTGVFMCLGVADPSSDADDAMRRPACCSPEAAEDARRIARQLGIRFHVIDLAAEFAAVLDYFAAEYAAGRTPNPCAKCNEWLKFGRLLYYADAAGAEYITTGHHARIESHQGAPAILRGRDRAKDQSYVLFGIPGATLGRVLLPIGRIAEKNEVRRIAERLGLSVADKPDSQDICFVTDGRYTDLLASRAPAALRAGPIVDDEGRRVGTHEGVGRFTIGQRRGLRIAAGVPMYVTAIDAASATVTIGSREAAMSDGLIAAGANWHSSPPGEPFAASVQIRYNHEAEAATVHCLDGGRFRVRFDRPVHAVTPGQIAAVYDGDRLLGGGWIESTGDEAGI